MKLPKSNVDRLNELAASNQVDAACKGFITVSIPRALKTSRGLSVKQHAWALRIIAEHEPQKELPLEVGANPNFSGIVGLVNLAATRLKYPKVKFYFSRRMESQDPEFVSLVQRQPELERIGDIKIQRAGDRSRYTGAMMVTDGEPYGHNRYYGRIGTDGTFHMSRDCTDDVVNWLVRFNQNPATLAAIYGKHSGHCCFCMLPLTDIRSLSVGYGPVCADHYHMPWGNKNAVAA